MKKKTKIILIVILLIILIGGGITLGLNWNSWFGSEQTTADIDNSAEDYTGDKETYKGKKNTDTISIPGFDVMNLQAGVTEQKVNLHNPEKNICYFKMTLFLNDGTKLWESKLIKPGKAVYEITLSQALQAGTYEDCVLKYECFKMDKEQTPLNGSEIKFTMNVLE